MAFKTFVALDPFLASEANTYLMKQAVIVCTSGTRPGSPVEGMVIYETDTDRILVYNGAAWVTITPVSDLVATAQTTTSTSYAALATAGPVASAQTATRALVIVGCGSENSTNGQGAAMSFAVSGATTIAAGDTTRVRSISATGANRWDFSRLSYLTALTAGVNTCTALYNVSANTGTFRDRSLTLIGVP